MHSHLETITNKIKEEFKVLNETLNISGDYNSINISKLNYTDKELL